MEYHPLDKTVGAIRIIKILPCSRIEQRAGPQEDVIECEVEHQVLGGSVSYTALSYAWGAQRLARPIIIGDRVCLVSDTVEQALRQLRHETEYKCVWIDQICINQGDDREKSHQVEQMRHIYSGAEEVVAWLGPPFDDSAFLFTYMNFDGQGLKDGNYRALLQLHKDENVNKRIARAFDRFCTSSYWSRLWIMQEYAVGPRLTIACGESTISSDLIDEIMRVKSELQEASRRTKLTTAMQKIAPIYETVARSFVENSLTRRDSYRSGIMGAGDGESLLEVLVTSLVLEVDYNFPETTDPRDRIFSLLHLADDVSDFPDFPDYSKSCEEVYVEAATIFLGQGYVDLLGYCQFPKTAELNGLPTWAPDWNMRLRAPCSQALWHSRFSASGLERSQPKPRGRELILQGVLVDTVKCLGDSWDPNWIELVDRKKAKAYLQQILNFGKQSARIRINEERLDAAKIAIADGAGVNVSGHLFIEGCTTAFTLLNQPIRPHKQGKEQIYHQDLRLEEEHWFLDGLKRLHSRRPFISTTGYVGLCPDHTLPGDDICVFLGGNTPYLIRRNDSDTFTLVGESYVHGIMYGEIMKPGPVMSAFTIV